MLGKLSTNQALSTVTIWSFARQQRYLICTMNWSQSLTSRSWYATALYFIFPYLRKRNSNRPSLYRVAMTTSKRIVYINTVSILCKYSTKELLLFMERHPPENTRPGMKVLKKKISHLFHEKIKGNKEQILRALLWPRCCGVWWHSHKPQISIFHSKPFVCLIQFNINKQHLKC